MHGQENHTNQSFHRPPPAIALPPPPPPSHRGPYQNAPVVSSSAQSYLRHSHIQAPQVHVSNQTSYCYSTSQQYEPRSNSNQNVHQYPSHPPYSSGSSFLTSDPFGSGPLPPPLPMGPLPPQPPPPPPCQPLPLTSSLPRVPPPPPPSIVFSKNDGSQSSKELLDGDNLVVGLAEDGNVRQNESPFYHTENDRTRLGSVDAVVAYSTAGSDMEMEDDITHPDGEKKDHLSTNSNGGCTSLNQEDFVKEQLQALQHTREHGISEDSVLKDQRGGFEADESGMTNTEQTEQTLEACVNESYSQLKSSSQPSLPVVYDETGCEKFSGQLTEGQNAFNLLQGYASDNISENDGKNLLEDVSCPDINEGSSAFDAQKVRADSLSESNKHMLPDFMTESPKNVMKADNFSDKSRRGHESVTTSAAALSKDHSRSYDGYMDLEGAKSQKQDRKSNPTEMKVDEFGRLVRGVSDSDTSDSPRYTRRHARRARKRSSSQSRSRSPHFRRKSPRRRSPMRRKARRGRSRSSSPKRCRSRSRSPVLRRDAELSGDKLRREKSQLPECFDFLRGKCYRGSSCRYSHHKADKSKRSRQIRSKPQSPLRSPDVHVEDKVLYDKQVEDKGPHQDTPDFREARDAKELHVDSISPDKLSNRSGYSDKMPQIVYQLGKRMGDSLVSESSSPVQVSADTSAHLLADAKQGPTSRIVSVENPIAKPYHTEEVQPQSLKELPASVPNFPSQISFSLSPVSQVMTSVPSGKDYIHSTLEKNRSLYQAPLSYQHSHFPGSLNPLPSSYLPPPPPPLPSHHLPVNTWNGLPSYTSIGAQSTELPNRFQTSQYQAYQFPLKPDQIAQSQAYGSFGPSDSNFSHGHPYFQRASYGPQYSGGGVPVQFAQPENVSSSTSGITPDFHVHNFTGSQIANRVNLHASTFDLPPSSTTNNVATVVSNYTIPLSNSGLPAQITLPGPGGDQYDPLFDSIEQPASLSRADHRKHETPGDSDNTARHSGFGRVNEEIIKLKQGEALSANGSIENEEFGETADAEVGDVLSGSLSTPNDATNTNAGEFEIDQVTDSGKKRKGKGSRSMKLFKISIAGFVKDVLKPSWLQGNMSKEAFKTIVKKTVDKVSGAMKGHHIPKSQAKIDHYIDSSRGKLTKLVMGYVDKYVKA